MAPSDVALVVLDGFAGRPLGTVGPLDLLRGEHPWSAGGSPPR
ncbi:hypothetical protein [Streptomyces sp. NPDC006274]